MTDEIPRDLLYASRMERNRRALYLDPEKPIDPITITLSAKEARQLCYMAEGWLDEFSPSQMYAGIEAGFWERDTVRRAAEKLEIAMYPLKPPEKPERKTAARVKRGSEKLSKIAHSDGA